MRSHQEEMEIIEGWLHSQVRPAEAKNISRWKEKRERSQKMVIICPHCENEIVIQKPPCPNP